MSDEETKKDPAGEPAVAEKPEAEADPASEAVATKKSEPPPKPASEPPAAAGDEDEDEDEDDEDDEDDDEEEAAAAPAPKPVAAVASQPPAKHDHGHGHGHEPGHPAYGHVIPVKLLGAICGALMVLTIVTVAVTYVDLGIMNLVIALFIATIKASLVIAFFMHLRWDARFNVLVFVGSFLFVILFLSIAITDRSEYQPSIDEHQAAEAK